MATWTFLTNHAIVLLFLAKHALITGRELSRSIGITERSVRNIISDLKSKGSVTGSKEGRQVRYRINTDLPFRHHTPTDKAIKFLLKSLDLEQKRKGTKRQKASSKAVS